MTIRVWVEPWSDDVAEREPCIGRVSLSLRASEPPSSLLLSRAFGEGAEGESLAGERACCVLGLVARARVALSCNGRSWSRWSSAAAGDGSRRR